MQLPNLKNHKANILVVDDIPDNIRLLSTMLTEQGFEVRKALNGKLALTACQMILPDLILLDINMPGMDGYEVCEQLKADEKTAQVPVIFISALDDMIDKEKAFKIGGLDYITKPFDGAEVILRVKNQLQLRALQLQLQEKNVLLQQTLDNLQSTQLERIQSEKMVSLGQLVAGIAHEFNNPISFIYGNLQYANQYVQELVNLIKIYQDEYPEPVPRIQQIIEEIDIYFLVNDLEKLMSAMHRGSNRIREIVMALQNFSRLDEAQMKRVNIHEGIDNCLVMLTYRLNKTTAHPNIDVVKDYGNLPLVHCYPGELNQVFMHLLNNAIDAFEQLEVSNDKSLTINKAFENRHYFQSNSISPSINNPQIRIHTQITDSQTVKIAIADNGRGIDESLRSRLFDPFFTTKPVGRGSGLGLSISYQIIVQKHQGKLTYISSPETGTEFMIEIPIYQPEI
ncbi:response regulator [Cronbergia sp. UHCC 0137]|uniref:hybrid sensor histidine kinase/response regulator n=1 Tax=Cronbergia sp. UHCC 0137 TaxID=3110239 RepID=UPI002B206FDB|nr:response regulator [Cronbergia sp. UHCC 0137]MEA5617404.1 response regulator [Cronbergia sp. UHCC 0137]